MKVTLRAAKTLEKMTPGLRWIEVTTFGDLEPMVVITTPRCAYCGRLSPEAQCPGCGASVLRDGDGR